MKDARAHHYNFAHRVLPALFFQDPQRAVALLARLRSEDLLALWKQAGRGLPPWKIVSPLGMVCHVKSLRDGATLVVITMPSPVGTTEAHFVAMAYRPGQGDGAKAPLARYITLEHSFLPDGTPTALLCEWTAQRVHHNYGGGPRPALDAFAAAVENLCAGKDWRASASSD